MVTIGEFYASRRVIFPDRIVGNTGVLPWSDFRIKTTFTVTRRRRSDLKDPEVLR